MDKVYNIGCIGAGNVANHLLPALLNAGHRIIQVISRSVISAQSLADKLDAAYSCEISRLDPDLDILFLTVPDNILPDLINEIAWFQGVVVHTSGTMPLSCFSCVKYPNGILYPLQTFSKQRHIRFTDVPIFIEGSNEKVVAILTDLAKQISSRVSELSSEKRAFLHMAAIFANNFTNYLITSADDILQEAGIERDVLNSLIRETLEKAIDSGIAPTQTGPAIRGDNATIKKHLNLLSFSSELKSIYQCLTISIQEYYSDRSEDK